MKTLTLNILMLTATVWSNAETESKPDDLDKKIFRTLQHPLPWNADTSWLTEEIRPEVIRRLLDQVADESHERLNGREKAEETLVLLGHVETIRRLVAEAESDRENKALAAGAAEVATPYMMPIVYNGSTEIPKPTSDVGYGSVRDSYVLNILRVIERSKVFPAETKEWAKNMLLHQSDKEHVNLLKSWWENNRQAIEEKRYAEATWLPRHKGKPLYVAESEVESLERRLEIGRQIEAKEEAERQRIALEAAKPPEAPVTPVPPVEEKSAPWLWISLCALAVLLAGFFLRRKLAAKAG